MGPGVSWELDSDEKEPVENMLGRGVVMPGVAVPAGADARDFLIFRRGATFSLVSSASLLLPLSCRLVLA